jgi:dolichol-phosphate mannosyltransferase
MTSDAVDLSAYGSISIFDTATSSSRPGRRAQPWYGPDGVSVVIPAWNEERRLPGTLDQYLRLLEAFGLPFEVLVVADGVTDRTVEVAAEFSEHGVRTISFSQRLGKGGAVLEGFRAAKFEIVGFLDADAPITPVSLAYLLSGLTSADAAIASRWVPGSSWERRQPLSRRAFSRMWNLMTRSLLGLHVRDTQCGAKFFKREAVSTVLNQVVLTNWAFDASLLFHFKRAGFSIVEIPVDWNDDANTKIRLEVAVPAMFLSIIGIRLMTIPFLPKATRAWAGWLHHRLNW